MKQQQNRNTKSRFRCCWLIKAVRHIDEGVTMYHYDENHYISQAIDHAYVMNEYNDNGHVVTQHYLDGNMKNRWMMVLA